MKKTIIIFNILFFYTLAFSQVQRTKTVSMSELANYPLGSIMGYPQIPKDVAYLKDDTGLLDKYVGKWKGTANGRTLEFEFTKKLEVAGSYSSLKKDILIGRLIAKDASGRVIFDTSNQDEIPLKGFTFTGGLKRYAMNYTGLKLECGESGFIFLTLTDNILDISFQPLGDIVVIGDEPGRCPKDYVPILNRTGLELTKQ
ncbi:hypothetical protein CMT75_18580 [Elizabethkingia anophelis]|uniref:hypothetical protein n=1 Tax=Elizabethkingia sp. M8 TaxID=2796140 RepID=UPI0019089BCF|nr:hypothetical protein [Elizabethkingia sp. M8]MDV3950524.1 hypothetical protein [Elizabethkingia anophelis]QQM26599.1 hypothetical protein JCR23_17435 [Elizabethkingia sp. M8]